MNKADGKITAEDTAPATTGLPVLPPLSAIAEIVIVFAMIYGLDALTPNQAILDLSPHPFWIPVLLVSLQYGTVSGLIAAAIAIGLSMFAGLPEQDIGENLFTYFLRVWGQPVLWIAVALLVGQFRMRQLAVKLELKQENRELRQQRNDLARHAGELRGRVERLEQELVARHVQSPHKAAAALADTIRKGGLGAEADRHDALLQASTAIFPNATIVAYCLHDRVLTECAVVGRKPDTGSRIRIESTDPIYRAVVDHRRTLTVLDRLGELALAGAGLAAVPIAGGDDDELFGVLIVESADPEQLRPEGLAALQLLAYALAPRTPRRESLPLPAKDYSEVTPRISHIRMSSLAGITRRGIASRNEVAPNGRQDRRTSLISLLEQAREDGTAKVTISKSGEDSGNTTDESAVPTIDGATGDR